MCAVDRDARLYALCSLVEVAVQRRNIEHRIAPLHVVHDSRDFLNDFTQQLLKRLACRSRVREMRNCCNAGCESKGPRELSRAGAYLRFVEFRDDQPAALSRLPPAS